MDPKNYPWYIPFSLRKSLIEQNLPPTQPKTPPPKSYLNFSIERLLEPLFKCDDCQMTFKQKIRFDFHRCLFCKPCKKLFTRRNYFTEHQRIVHEGGAPCLDRFTCDYCGATSANKLSLERHMREKHLKMERKFQCDLCPQSFNLKFRLSTHMIIHKSSLFCEMCQQYYSRAYFIRHVRDIHATAHNHLCIICHRRFKSIRMLRHHESTHEKRFECNNCGKKYSYQHHFDAHMEKHRGNYQCALCSSRFVSISQLKMHLYHHINCQKLDKNEELIEKILLMRCDEQKEKSQTGVVEKLLDVMRKEPLKTKRNPVALRRQSIELNKKPVRSMSVGIAQLSKKLVENHKSSEEPEKDLSEITKAKVKIRKDPITERDDPIFIDSDIIVIDSD